LSLAFIAVKFNGQILLLSNPESIFFLCLHSLSPFYPDPSRFMEVQDSGRDLVVESANFAFNSLYMEIPKGMEASVDECLILNKIMYGLVQSAREFYNKLVSALKDCGFQGSLVDPCL
jgi:hypothetical protein